MKTLTLILTLTLTLTLVGCTSSRWAKDGNLYSSLFTHRSSLSSPSQDSLSQSGSSADIFYIVSTEIMDGKDCKGKDHYIAKLTEEDRAAIKAEMDFVHDMFGDSLNFFSPYYKQFTFSALNLPDKKYAKIRKKASKDAVSAFRYYMRHMNNGRPFFLAGFSQGGMHLIDVVKQMKPKEYERMVAAYSMGYRLSAEDLKHPQVKAAKSADDLGTIVSFNSVTTPEDAWDVVSKDAATCMNPVNFRTDEEKASFVFDGDTLSVHVDTKHNLLIVESKNMEAYRFPPLETFCKPGNLHHWDLMFYGNFLRNNAHKRLLSK